ncbi:hypothetical protein [Litorilituus lipolyticus]|uniref:Four helix bundle protein n=1 Tax=Litorilituus lipolyticus TaxID=2491017 RepID=A0A502KZ80_9GAMM|nr:hypothetical protein [Litorilituus lipolyticus]TPH15869.1 hypothetical protein EPA86_07830 [Litorilituus lipolyticus]
MRSTLNYSKAINTLSLWAAPTMWHDKSIYAEIIVITNKLSNTSYQLNEREYYIVQELTNGVLEVILNLMKKADDFEYDELGIIFNEITQLQSFLFNNELTH